jgi:hypothetical protein
LKNGFAASQKSFPLRGRPEENFRAVNVISGNPENI